ncbi:alpha-2-macroglobulin [Arenibacter sp. 6A1]|uniref:alpha-2-macroglobulin family protein n=1 Tax=Arenibacter sp. 6A1 TaxID=2720391 RepID=UPI001445BC8B|nr:MG2 domain-containing protein [Arenibacter sp. 6A1]NKI28126.1 alpha-2-macroglobulin [Arenibacter sp. 6A1]
MRNLTILITVLLFSHWGQSQSKAPTYAVLWEQVQTLEKEAMTKSAMEVVTKISNKARKERNAVQIIKALLYNSKYILILEEDAQLNIINNFKSEISQSSFPTKNILESYLAQMYWQYFQENRYRFYDRTPTATPVDNDDFRTWDLTTIFTAIGSHFDSSLATPDALQQVDIREYLEILHKEKGSEIYRPTLFDLLAHNAIDFYKSSENSIARPADKFEIDNPEYLSEFSKFSTFNFTSDDNTSQQLKALLAYQQLIKAHQNDALPFALVDIDIERLKFIRDNAIFEKKDQYYLEALQHAAQLYKNQEAESFYTFEIALLYHQLAENYIPGTQEEHQWKRKKALEICETALKKYPKGKTAEKFSHLRALILSQELQITTEKHLPINRTARLLVNYKNHDNLKFTAYQISQKELTALQNIYPLENQLPFIEKLKVATTWEARLKNEGDYIPHKTEVLLPSLNQGNYIVLATPVDNDDKKSFAFSPVQVTDLAFIETKSPTHHFYQVVDRNNGKPLSGAKVSFTYQTDTRAPFLKKSFVADETGMVILPLTKERWLNTTTKIEYHGDTAYFGKYSLYPRNNYDDYEHSKHTTFLFTDRSIYRPGQPVFFKGIAVSQKGHTSSLITNTLVKAHLRDVNGQEIAAQEFKTNEFGSFDGEFIIPNNGLTGTFSIASTSEDIALSGITSFSVEEYKRPKFKTSFDPITDTFSVHDSIEVKGTALAYSGSAISDATVRYRVRRLVNFPRWFYWFRPNYGSSPQEIAHGETKTDALGFFNIPFVAIPDSNVSKDDLPIFLFEVTAEVTDINGETQSSTTTIKVGYHALLANIETAPFLDKNKKNNLVNIRTSNLNGQPVPAQGTLKIYKLKGPEYVLRPRPWEAPEYKLGTKEEFKKIFPHDAYDKESDPNTWEKSTLAYETNFNTGKTGEIKLGKIKNWTSGVYQIELETTDAFGQKVKDMAKITVHGSNDKQVTDQKLFEIKTDQHTYAPGENATLTIGSSAKNLTVTLFIEKNKTIVDTQIITLHNNTKTIKIPITESDLGGFSVHYTYSAFNSFETGIANINVPYPKTDLQIETVTFRDKLQPGSEEQWSFTIKGGQGQKVAAEVLANMYDASLDAFQDHSWSFTPRWQPTYYSSLYSNAYHSYRVENFTYFKTPNAKYPTFSQAYDSFNWFGFYFGERHRLYRNTMVMKKANGENIIIQEDSAAMEESVLAGFGTQDQQSSTEIDAEKNKNTIDQVQIRKNLQETAFFFPQLRTDKNGNVSFSFTSPEALTTWKLQLLAHTKNLESKLTTMEAVTQKEIMITPNVPRFLRESDKITISTKIANITDSHLNGTARIILVDAVSGKDITKNLLVSSLNSKDSIPPHETLSSIAKISYTVNAHGNTEVSWNLTIPENLQGVQYTIMATAGDYSDGEQNLLPVLTNRTLVTETLPMWVKSNQTKSFDLEKLRTNTSSTLKHHQLSLEITSNPAWYAVQALPYLMEYPFDCSEQIFARYYANTLASSIVQNQPRIQEVFKQWANTDAVLSNLEKNQALKSILIQETPWLRDAQSETEQKKRIALLFNLNKMKNERENALRKLQNSQLASGAWPWFKGGISNRFITQHILAGLGHLDHLNILNLDMATEEIIKKAIAYLDAEFMEDYEKMRKDSNASNADHLSPIQLHYLYTRSFFSSIPASKKVSEITLYYKKQAQKFWVKKDLYSQGLLALFLHRSKDTASAKKIIKSLEENSVTREELGMYWKANTNSWNWNQAAIETQALLIEAFSEINNDTETIDQLKLWLLKNKQTNQWETTKATTDAVYALLLQGSNWLSVTDAVEVSIGEKKIAPSKLKNTATEAGTGYFKVSWTDDEIVPEMAKVVLSKKGEGPAWGAMYWQYFEELDKISPGKSPLQLKKKLFLKQDTDTGEELREITASSELNLGDVIRVRIEIRTDRAMEFIHMKDMRAAGLEPVKVLSQYQWQDGLGYYESTKDASTSFFIDYLPKGVYVFEYDLRVNNKGEFSNGITSIQSMYAPEFSSHSKGERISVN